MASVLQQYHQLADRMAAQITGSYQSWTDFLTTAARLYKYPYHEQLMIYAQRPEATACADYELWNKRMGRYVRRGAKGIALIDHSGDTPKLKYVFDVADTRTTERSRSPYFWEFRPEHEQVVSDSLELQYDIRYPGSFSDLLEQISSVKVTEYFSKLKIMKADYKSKQYRLEDNLLRHFPEQIEKLKGYIQAIQEDMKTLEAHPHPTDGFAGMTVLADDLTDKDNAGAALIEAAKKATGLDPVEVGTYRGFQMSVTLEDFGKKYVLTMQGRLRHQATLGSDPRGNLIRLDNALAQMSQRLKAFQTQLDETYHQQEAAKAELDKPFPYEEELRDKTARLIFLDAELNLDANKGGQQEQVVAKAARPSVLDKLRSQPAPSRTGKKQKRHEEVR